MRLCLLWHMHQPDYRLPDHRSASMPWVRLHAAKDYVDIVRYAVEEAVPVTVNAVPVLLDQLDAAAAGIGDPFRDACLTPPSELADEPRLERIERCFQLPRSPMIDAIPAFRGLARKKDRAGSESRAVLDAFSDQDLVDLAVLYHLSWCGPSVRAETHVSSLLEAGGPYTGGDLLGVLAAMDRACGAVLPAWRRWARGGAIEISVTPYFHPILPLLHDERAVAQARPGSAVPGRVFRWPADAREQVARGLERLELALGWRPQGLWPSEGALSAGVLDQLGELGIRWTATDQQLLGKAAPTAGAGAHLQPWAWPGGPRVFFRDTNLSDSIGFRYARMPVDDAVADFLERARALARRWEGPGEATVCVVLDGENAWEHYEGQGEPFLRHFYAALRDAPDIRPMTFSDALAEQPSAPTLPRFLPGSWIRGDLDTWAGHPDKNRAWELLAEARDAYAAWAPTADAATVELAKSHLFAAEGSDWFWWLGDDHPTPWLAAFDRNFRAHLCALHRVIGKVPPASLDEPISRGRGGDEHLCPTGPVRGLGDASGLPWSLWSTAGTFVPGQVGGAMRTGGQNPCAVLRYGFDERWLHVLIEGPEGGLQPLVGATADVVLHGVPPPERARLGAGWEARFDRESLGPPETELQLAVEIRTRDGHLHRLPTQGTLRWVVPGAELYRKDWNA